MGVWAYGKASSARVLSGHICDDMAQNLHYCRAALFPLAHISPSMQKVLHAVKNDTIQVRTAELGNPALFSLIIIAPRITGPLVLLSDVVRILCIGNCFVSVTSTLIIWPLMALIQPTVE